MRLYPWFLSLHPDSVRTVVGLDIAFLKWGMAMGQKLRVSKRKPLVRWTPERLVKLMADLDMLKQQVRVAEAAYPKTSTPASSPR